MPITKQKKIRTNMKLIYRYILTYPGVTANEISEELRLNYLTVRKILRTLVKENIVTFDVIGKKVKRYYPLSKRR